MFQLKESNPLTQPVNVVISALFIVSFGLVATSLLLKAADLDDPISGLGIALAERMID